MLMWHDWEGTCMDIPEHGLHLSSTGKLQVAYRRQRTQMSVLRKIILGVAEKRN